MEVIALSYQGARGASNRPGKGLGCRSMRLAICIDVPDLAAGTAFYCDGLGCRLASEHDGYNTLELDGTTIHVAGKEAGSHPVRGNEAVSRVYERHWTPVHLDFYVEDLEAALERVLALGATREGGAEGDWGAAAFCADPFGNGFCLLKVD